MMFGRKKEEETPKDSKELPMLEEIIDKQKSEKPEELKETDEQQNPQSEESILGTFVGDIQSNADTENEIKAQEALQNHGEASAQETKILILLNGIQHSLEGLESTFKEKLMRSAQEEKILDSMHEELQKYRADIYASLLRPILSDLCSICDSILRNKALYEERAKENGETPPMVPLELLTNYAYELQDLLANNDILVYRTKTGDAFNPAKHRAIKKVKIAQEELHGKIAESQSAGYLYCGKTLSPEKVSVYYFEKTAENVEKVEEGEK